MKPIAGVGADYCSKYEEFLDIASATESLWLTAPPTTELRRRLKVPQLEALYEATFLRVFASWESFLEETLIRFMARGTSPSHAPVATSGKSLYRSIAAAHAALYGGKTYLLWHNVSAVITRAQAHLFNSPIETVLTARKTDLEMYAAIRHRIAHESVDAKQKFESAALGLTGSVHGGKPGRLLRAADISDPLNQSKWIRVIVTDLADITRQICA